MTNTIKGTASIMVMNNIYYRFTHLVKDEEYQRMPANLQMDIIVNPGVDKKDFELYYFAVSAINGSGLCIDAHVNTLVNRRSESKSFSTLFADYGSPQ